MLGCIVNCPLSHPCNFGFISDWSMQKEWVIDKSLFKPFVAMHSSSLILNYHLPEVSISGLGFSTKVRSKQTVKLPAVTEHKGQKVKCVGSINSHFPYFSFFSSISHFLKDSLIFYTETLINPFVMLSVLHYYQVESQVCTSFRCICSAVIYVYDP